MNSLKTQVLKVTHTPKPYNPLINPTLNHLQKSPAGKLCLSLLGWSQTHRSPPRVHRPCVQLQSTPAAPAPSTEAHR